MPLKARIPAAGSGTSRCDRRGPRCSKLRLPNRQVSRIDVAAAISVALRLSGADAKVPLPNQEVGSVDVIVVIEIRIFESRREPGHFIVVEASKPRTVHIENNQFDAYAGQFSRRGRLLVNGAGELAEGNRERLVDVGHRLFRCKELFLIRVVPGGDNDVKFLHADEGFETRHIAETCIDRQAAIARKIDSRGRDVDDAEVASIGHAEVGRVKSTAADAAVDRSLIGGNRTEGAPILGAVFEVEQHRLRVDGLQSDEDAGER